MNTKHENLSGARKGSCAAGSTAAAKRTLKSDPGASQKTKEPSSLSRALKKVKEAFTPSPENSIPAITHRAKMRLRAWAEKPNTVEDNLRFCNRWFFCACMLGLFALSITLIQTDTVAAALIIFILAFIVALTNKG